MSSQRDAHPSVMQSPDNQTVEAIRILGARTHNLKNINVSIPSGKLVVITGPSGAGKSSLAFDTLYAEGQRQYLESLSVYARQFMEQMPRPNVDSIEGLEPTLCINQRPGIANPRSTVATTTDIYDYLRLLMARLGTAACPECGQQFQPQSEEQILDTLLQLTVGTKVMLLAPLVRGRKGEHAEEYAAIRKHGWVRARVDGQVFDIEHLPPIDPHKPHSLDAVVDRIVIREGVRARLAESLQLCLKHGQGLVTILYLEPEKEALLRTSQSGDNSFWTERLFSTLYACPDCGVNFEELEPRTFSFNSPYGACPACEGLGEKVAFDIDLVAPDKTISMAQGLISPWRNVKGTLLKKVNVEIKQFLESQQKTWETPLSDLTDEQQRDFWHGTSKKFIGVLQFLEQEYATTLEESRQEFLATFRGAVPCIACNGSRLRSEARAVKFREHSIFDITQQSVTAASQFFNALVFSEEEKVIAEPLVKEIRHRLDFLNKVGVGYLTLNRATDTLSGGELQRVRLASCIGSGLAGVCYVLDEPSIGLHPRDNMRLLQAMRQLQEQGSTVVVVEHDESLMRHADWLIDIGPQAGEQGGQLIACGTPRDVMLHADSITGKFLSGRELFERPLQRRKVTKSNTISLEACSVNNLKNIQVTFPLGVFICVTGVSGSGKSSLINETLVPAVLQRLGVATKKPAPHTSLRGVNAIDKLISINQRPIGRSPRSNAATYLGLFDEIRKIFATTREAKQLGFSSSRFSFNASGGRCDACQGQGVERIEMQFLPDCFVTCKQCQGTRFNTQTLTVKYRGFNIAQVLDMSVSTAAQIFENHTLVSHSLQSLQEVGLGYLRLGQPSNTLSGGEAQRIKLAAELARTDTGKTLYVLDEPTTGLHFEDTRRLLRVLHRLVEKGNTVLVIEHCPQVMLSADWLIDLGPEGGANGGELLFAGTPEEIVHCDRNETGKYLREMASMPKIAEI